MSRLRGRMWTSTTCLVSILLFASCGASQDEAAAAVAKQLRLAVEQARGDEACRLLAPAARAELEDWSGKACERAVLEEDLGTDTTPARVQVFDTMAQVSFADDTVFLSRFDGSWLVVAAACSARAGRPYDCGIQVS